MTARERLEEILGGKVENDHEGDLLGHIADRLLAAGVTLPPAPTSPSPVWPGLEGEGLNRMSEVWITSSREAKARGLSYNDVRRAGYTAQAAHLWRAMVASLPRRGGGWVLVGGIGADPTSLAALADPYDGGGK
ncbi:MAG: hypothetical protein KA744_16270 [Phenylobacterium sp.]|nr:hypothetical protein [Phenylobacterium sp.]